ncbi:unnamed protein product [Closterium sp. NIES-65]|nr:unnamed protein product [Closterium sp. NIES-65]
MMRKGAYGEGAEAETGSRKVNAWIALENTTTGSTLVRSVDVKGVILKGVILKGVILKGVIMKGVILKGVIMKGILHVRRWPVSLAANVWWIKTEFATASGVSISLLCLPVRDECSFLLCSMSGATTTPIPHPIHSLSRASCVLQPLCVAPAL